MPTKHGVAAMGKGLLGECAAGVCLHKMAPRDRKILDRSVLETPESDFAPSVYYEVVTRKL